MVCYEKAAALGDAQAYNNMGIMLETGYDDVVPQPNQAYANYKAAYDQGSSDAALNIALFYLNANPSDIAKIPEIKNNVPRQAAKELLIKAHQMKNPKAMEALFQYNLINSEAELEGAVHTANLAPGGGIPKALKSKNLSSAGGHGSRMMTSQITNQNNHSQKSEPYVNNLEL